MCFVFYPLWYPIIIATQVCCWLVVTRSMGGGSWLPGNMQASHCSMQVHLFRQTRAWKCAVRLRPWSGSHYKATLALLWGVCITWPNNRAPHTLDACPLRAYGSYNGHINRPMSLFFKCRSCKSTMTLATGRDPPFLYTLYYSKIYLYSLCNNKKQVTF